MDPFAWPRADAAAGGVAAGLGAALDEGVRGGKFPDLHAVVVVRHGAIVLERYYTGPDERWGTPLGCVAFDARTRHDLRSVSKSIVGLLYGIALAEGKVPAPDQPVLDAFPAYADLAAEPARRAITIAHVLSMTMGLAWNEDLPYTDPANSEIAMERSADRYRYVLSQPIVGAPGAAWRYSGGATALLGHLIARGTGMPLLEYARARLFAPLGIEDVEWTPGLNGEAAAASGLRMRAPDLARVGQLVLDQGRWQGRSVVPADWITASLSPRTAAFEGVQYGYHWYLARRADGTPFGTLGIGLGGQRLVVVPGADLVYVVFMGNYYRKDQLGPVFGVQGLVHGAIR
ncbi:serine hydrolase [Pseudorhodoferax sp. Leaf265]|nr:serine hydrolase [Pseudorhodoferax sp. Leaf265]